jgi:hypothetical protein
LPAAEGEVVAGADGGGELLLALFDIYRSIVIFCFVFIIIQSKFFHFLRRL